MFAKTLAAGCVSRQGLSSSGGKSTKVSTSRADIEYLQNTFAYCESINFREGSHPR